MGMFEASFLSFHYNGYAIIFIFISISITITTNLSLYSPSVSLSKEGNTENKIRGFLMPTLLLQKNDEIHNRDKRGEHSVALQKYHTLIEFIESFTRHLKQGHSLTF